MSWRERWCCNLELVICVIRYNKYNHKSENSVHLFELCAATELIQLDRYVKRRCIC
jgi:hypothetical protein